MLFLFSFPTKGPLPFPLQNSHPQQSREKPKGAKLCLGDDPGIWN